MELKIGDSVEFKPENYDTMIGVIDRIVKVPGPFQPATDDQSLWTYHVLVTSNHPRNSGLFCMDQSKLTKLDNNMRQVKYEKIPMKNSKGTVVNHWHSVEIYENGDLKLGLGCAGPVTDSKIKALILESKVKQK